jgi:hypothetical protein
LFLFVCLFVFGCLIMSPLIYILFCCFFVVKLFYVIVLLVNDISHSRCVSTNVKENRRGNQGKTTEINRLHKIRDTKRKQTKQKPPDRKLRRWSIRTIPVHVFFYIKHSPCYLKPYLKPGKRFIVI